MTGSSADGISRLGWGATMITSKSAGGQSMGDLT